MSICTGKLPVSSQPCLRRSSIAADGHYMAHCWFNSSEWSLPFFETSSKQIWALLCTPFCCCISFPLAVELTNPYPMQNHKEQWIATWYPTSAAQLHHGLNLSILQIINYNIYNHAQSVLWLINVQDNIMNRSKNIRLPLEQPVISTYTGM